MLAGLAVFQLAGIGAEADKRKESYVSFKDDAVTGQEQGKAGGGDGGGGAEDQFDYRSVKIDFDLLKQKNEDIVGWILFDGNGISYPVLQGTDNEEYLYKMADGTKNPAGSIFIDSQCSADFTDSHTIIYGHNMKDLSMFGKLKLYRTQEGYYEKNRYFTIYAPDRICRYEIFSWYEAKEDDAVYQAGFTEDDTFAAFVEQMVGRRYRDTMVTAGKEDKIVTLSTCSAEGMRLVVHGKRIREIIKEKDE